MWERLGEEHEHLERTTVPGGWLYRHRCPRGVALSFVPDAAEVTLRRGDLLVLHGPVHPRVVDDLRNVLNAPDETRTKVLMTDPSVRVTVVHIERNRP